MRTILGIDPATKCGYALLTGLERPIIVESGTWNFGVGGGGSGHRFRELQVQLDVMLDTTKIDLVVYEVPGRLMGNAILLVNGMVAIIEAMCERDGVPYRGIAPAETKQAVGCKGNAQKCEVMAAVNSRYPHGAALRDDNECDAIAIAIFGIALLKGT